MTKVKITVLKTDFYPDLAAEYGKPELGPCAAMKVGDVFYADVKYPRASVTPPGTASISMFLP